MHFRTRVWQCLKGNKSKITNHYQYIIYAGSKSWETSLTSHLNFQPQSSSMENIIINTWLLGEQCKGMTAWSQWEEFAACAALLTSAKGKQEAFLCLGSILYSISFGAELCTGSRPQRTDLRAAGPCSVPDLWHQDFCLPAQSAAGWTLLHTVSRLWNASELASDTIKITNYRAQWE